MSQIESLAPKHHAFVRYLLSGMNTREAAKAVGVSRPTANRWLKLPAIQQELSAAQQQAQEQVIEETVQDVRERVTTGIQKLVPQALAGIETVLQGKPGVAMLEASKYVLNRIIPELPDQTSIQQEYTGPIPQELLPYVLEEELGLIESVLARAQQRKKEAEEKITPIRREA